MKRQKRTTPRDPEAVLSEHKDIIKRAFGEVKTSITFDEWWDLGRWLMENKRYLGKKYYLLRDWCEGMDDIVIYPPPDPPKRFICRYCGKHVLRSEVASTADNTVACRRCAYE